MRKKTQSEPSNGMKQTSLLNFFALKNQPTQPRTQNPPPVEPQIKEITMEKERSLTIPLDDNESEQGKMDEEFSIGQASEIENEIDIDSQSHSNRISRRMTIMPNQTYLLPFTDDELWEDINTYLAPIKEGSANLDKIFKIMEIIITKNCKPRNPDLGGLKQFICQMNQSERNECEQVVFPLIATLVLKTNSLFSNKIPFLAQDVTDSIKLSKEQCACLLANMFMGTTLKQNNPNLPWGRSFINFYTTGSMKDSVKYHKIKCLYHYFWRISKGISDQYVIFKRLILDPNIHGDTSVDTWKKCQDLLLDFEFSDSGKIEDAKNSIEVDFANKFLGGGVLDMGMVQEEIMFTISPECLVGILFSESMKNREAILIQGAEIFCEYQGYSGSFRFKSDFVDQRGEGKGKVVNREIIAIDALNFGYQSVSQFTIGSVLRELNKAFVGFFGDDDLGAIQRKVVSTGRWGCGAFGGDSQLKLLIQWAACSRANRKMLFYSFGDKFLNESEKILKHYQGKSVGSLVADILGYCEHLKVSNKKIDIYTYILSQN